MLKLEIVTPERRVLDTEVEAVTVPTASGEAGILTNHAPLVSELKPGVLTYTARGGAVDKLAIAGGFVEVSGNKVSVLTDLAETSGEINLESARAERDAAERELAAAASSDIDSNAALRERVEAANARLQIASGR
jgi:F-type H+-transporting ATPase subunit epsilon